VLRKLTLRLKSMNCPCSTSIYPYLQVTVFKGENRFYQQIVYHLHMYYNSCVLSIIPEFLIENGSIYFVYILIILQLSEDYDII